MRYDIRLSIGFAYANPANAGRHVLHLIPADLPGEQRLIAASLDIEPQPEERGVRTDFFGNRAVEVAYRTAHDEIEFGLQARVERLAQAPELDVSPPPEQLARELAGCRTLGPSSPLHFLGPSPRVPIDPQMSAYARAQSEGTGTMLESVEAIGLALNRDISFDPDATTVDTPPHEAFERRRGVCQDFSHVMIACLRGIGVPAGYVSGFLRTRPPEGEPRLEGVDAMHAWVRAWCGFETGWIEYDPTNAMFVGIDHIVVGRGRDYADVPPIKGSLRTFGEQSSTHSVDVIAL